MMPSIVLLYWEGYREIDKKHFFALCLVCLLTLLWAYLFIYGFQVNPGYKGKVAIGLFKAPLVWSRISIFPTVNCIIILLKGALSIVFPLYVLAMYRKNIAKDFQWLYAWTLFAFACIFVVFFYEKPNIRHGNFGWPAITATFLLFVASFMVFIENFAKDMRSYCGAALLGLHVAFGVAYRLKLILFGTLAWG